MEAWAMARCGNIGREGKKDLQGGSTANAE